MENKTRGQELELRIKQREDFIEGLLFEINIKDSESISKEITNDKWWIEWTSELKGIIETETKTDDEIIDELNKKGIIGLTSSYKEAISKARQSGRQSAQTEFEKLIDECACGKNDREWISIEELKSKLKSATTKEEKEKI